MKPIGVVLLLAIVSIVAGTGSLALFPSSDPVWAYTLRTLGVFVVLMFFANILPRRRPAPPAEREQEAEPAVAGFKIGGWQETKSGWRPAAGRLVYGEDDDATTDTDD